MTGEILLLQVGAAALLYLIIKNRLNAYVHPLRMRLAELGNSALSNPNISERSRSRIEFQLDNAYNGRIAWAFVFLLPFAAVKSLFDSFASQENTEQKTANGDETAIMVLATVSVLATSPIAAALFAIEVLVMAVLFVPLGKTLRTSERTLERAEQSLHHRFASR